MTQEAMKQALEALEKSQSALAEELSAWDFDSSLHHIQESHDLCGPAITSLRQAIAELESQEPVAWVDLQKEAQQIVESKILWKRFIDGTPLANDIACWMANFALQHTHPPQRTWVDLTDEEVELYWDWEDFQTGAGRSTIFEMVRDIEAKLKQLNT
jgi:hypothetical protein